MSCIQKYILSALFVGCLLAFHVDRVNGADKDEPVIDFQKQVRPIFAKHCFKCHGTIKQKSGLSLDNKDDAMRGGEGGKAIEPGKPDDSELFYLITSDDPEEIMPPKGEALSDKEIDIIRLWIKQGAKWPDESVSKDGRRSSSHWSFQPVKRYQPPQIKTKTWARNGIDHFILAKLESMNLKPSAKANRHTLIRRVYLDLLGLLPSVEEVDQFVKDKRADAYERLIDRVLRSPHYGERWGRHWLDQARYADSHGYSIDGGRTMWPYRDWVIQAINDDMPFDQFTIEQIAGDLLPNPTSRQRVATAFHRNTLINQEGGSKADQFRVEATIDRVNTTAQVWLGLTVACIQCHNHPFDPLTQKEFYQLFDFFNHAQDANNTGPTARLVSDAIQAKEKTIRDQMAAKAKAVKLAKDAAKKKQLQGEVNKLKAELSNLGKAHPGVMVMAEVRTPRKTHIHLRGDFLRPGDPVSAAVPEILPAIAKGSSKDGRKTRLDLAKWLVNPSNPLTPRVTVNRIWMRYFGRGLVQTEEDFGTQGTPPSHPKLLDYLADQFMQNKWSLKAMHKLIVTSATYRQSSNHRATLLESDPGNKWYARQSRIRVEGEIVRDLALSASGMLSTKIGGPSVHPPQPAGVYNFTQNKKGWPTSKGDDRYRRGMYTFFYRSAPYPMLTTFDSPDFTTTCTRRIRSNTPLQSLTMANAESMFELAQGLAVRTMGEVNPRNAASVRPDVSTKPTNANMRRINHAFRLALSRAPSAAEVDRLSKYQLLQLQRFAGSDAEAKKVAPAKRPSGFSDAEAASWVAVARTLMNLDEFITRE